MGRLKLLRRAGKQLVDGTALRLADEVADIQRVIVELIDEGHRLSKLVYSLIRKLGENPQS